MIEFRDLSVIFQEDKNNSVNAVNHVNLRIDDGDIFGIVGASGAGKSTLLRTINGLEKPTSGEVVVNGQSIGNLRDKELRKTRLGIGMIFQHFNLAANKTIAENLAFPLNVAHKSEEEIQRRVNELLELVDLQNKKDEYPSRLSGGQKQRVGIARALANQAQILLCDEPTSALDIETTNSILTLLKKLSLNLGITIVIITHELQVVKNLCNRTAVMNQGKVVEVNNTYELFTRPQHSFTRKLLQNHENLNIPQEVIDEIKDQNKIPGIRSEIYRVTYTGHTAAKPVIFELVRHFEVKINIIHGNIEYIQNKPKGILYINILGFEKEVISSIDYLKSTVYQVEELYHDQQQIQFV